MDEYELSCEPMDIDLSSNSVSAMDISYTELSFKSNNFDFSKVIIKKEKDIDVSSDDICRSPSPVNQNEFISRQSETVPVHPRNNKTLKNKLLWLSCLTVLLLSITIYQFSTLKCCDDLQLQSLKTLLQSRLFGQSAAIDTLIRVLEENNSKIVILYGGTGVGKTMTASLILEKKLEYSNIYHYTMPSFLQTISTEFMIGHTFCKSSLVVLDDLQENDILIVEEHLQELVNKSNKLSKDITIILVHNCDDIEDRFLNKCDTFLLQVRKTLNNININKHYIKFNPLNEEHLKKCIINELPNKAVSSDYLNKIAKNFNVKLDGCKGVYQKMKYLNIV